MQPRVETVYSTPKIFGAKFENSWRSIGGPIQCVVSYRDQCAAYGRSGVRSFTQIKYILNLCRLALQVSAQVLQALVAGLIFFWSHIYEARR